MDIPSNLQVDVCMDAHVRNARIVPVECSPRAAPSSRTGLQLELVHSWRWEMNDAAACLPVARHMRLVGRRDGDK